MFLEKYNEDTEQFEALYQNIDDIKNGSKLLKKYIQNSLVKVTDKTKKI